MQTSEVYKLLSQLKIIHKVAHLCREAGITFFSVREAAEQNPQLFPCGKFQNHS